MPSQREKPAVGPHTEDVPALEIENSTPKPIVIAMRVEDWQIIDGTIDNTVVTAATNGDNNIAEQGQNVREAGWEAARAHPRVEHGWGGWPPHGDEIRIALPLTAWRFIVEELHRWDLIDASLEIRDPDMPESQTLAIARLVAQHIGYSP